MYHPIGAYAIIQGEYVNVRAQVFGPDGEESVTGERDLPVETHASAAREFARDLAEEGARELVARADDQEEP